MLNPLNLFQFILQVALRRVCSARQSAINRVRLKLKTIRAFNQAGNTAPITMSPGASESRCKVDAAGGFFKFPLPEAQAQDSSQENAAYSDTTLAIPLLAVATDDPERDVSSRVHCARPLLAVVTVTHDSESVRVS